MQFTKLFMGSKSEATKICRLNLYPHTVDKKGGHQVRIDVKMGEGGLDPENVHI